MTKRIHLLFAALLLLAATCAAFGRDVEKADLFVAGEGGYAVYRIPGLVSYGKTALAYCEARRLGPADWGSIDVLARRSTDGGRTWGPPRKLVEPPADARPNPVAPPRKGGGITVNNPVAIAGETLHFLYCVEYGRCFYMRSEDGGATFSPPLEITPTFEKFRPEYDWKVIATGPGHGIQLLGAERGADGAYRLKGGRLVVPVWLSTSTKGPHRPSRTATIYSDDDGRTWQRGDLVPTPGLVNPSEASIAQAEGRVFLNIRHEGEPHRRAMVESRDGATGWSDVRLVESLPEPVCMGSMLGLGRPGDRGVNQLLFCNPDPPTGRGRTHLTVKLSHNLGKTWEDFATLEPGACGYSDLALWDWGVMCLYERSGTLTLAGF